ncbi:YoaK family small membrane protein, partial [Escherichia coli]|nr:YoaK family small membrane protein [Escherichia coli]
PVVIFITAVVFLAWFFIGGYALRDPLIISPKRNHV